MVSIKQVEKAGFILLILAVVVPIGLLFIAPEETTYQYDVKAEQVNDVDRVEDPTAFENLSQTERDVLFQAFKKSDHFLGASEVTVSSEQKMETFDGWRVIEIQGVVLLVAVDGPETVEQIPDDSNVMTVGFLFTAVGMIAGFTLMMAGKLRRSRRRRRH